MGDDLWCGQAQNGVISDFNVKFEAEGQGQSIVKLKGILTEVFYIFCLNLVVLASTRQACGWHTHTENTQTDAGNNTWRPKLASGKNG